MHKAEYELNVFVNCPFDSEYKYLFDALIFTIISSGFIPRCAKENSDTSIVRIDKICQLINESKYSIHDLSRVELDAFNNLPRFNMPMELGIVIGSKRFGNKNNKSKEYIVLDSEKHNYQKSTSDIAGQDILCHKNDIKEIIKHVRNWLSAKNKNEIIMSATLLHNNYLQFVEALPELSIEMKIDIIDITYLEYVVLATQWVSETNTLKT